MRRTFVLLVAIATAGCSGGVGSPVPMPTQRPVATATFLPAIFVTTAQSDAVGAPKQPYTLDVYPAGASGNVAPIVSTNFAGGILAADQTGSYWRTDAGLFTCDYFGTPCVASVIARHVRLDGTQLAQIVGPVGAYVAVSTSDTAGNLFFGLGSLYRDEDPMFPVCMGSGIEVAEYAPTAIGPATPTRTLDIPSPNFPVCSLNGIAVSPLGNVWLAASLVTGYASIATPQQETLYEYAPFGGSSEPIRTIVVPTGVSSLATDASGDLYYLRYDTQPPELVRSQPDGSAPTRILANVPIVAFTIGEHGKLLAEVATPTGLAIETFLPGATQPLATIAGSATNLDPDKLDVGGTLTVAP